jgi:hypothetical protein
VCRVRCASDGRAPVYADASVAAETVRRRARREVDDEAWRLAAVDVPAEVIERERQQMSEIAFGRTRSRSLLGSLNDFSLMARMHFVRRRTDTLERIARDLAETPLILPFDGEHPSTLTRRIFGAD